MKLKVLSALTFLLMLPAVSISQEALTKGQSVYLPVYSTIYFGDKKNEFNLTVTVNIRNTNTNNSIKIESIKYYSTDGKLISKFTGSAFKLDPLQSYQVVIKESDTSAGIGGHFIIRWSADKKVNRPVIESVMIGTKQQQGISFMCEGVVINEDL